MDEINHLSRRTIKRFGYATRPKTIFCAAALGFQANDATALPALYSHYDASDPANVTVDETGKVTALADSSNSYNADAEAGIVLYPDAIQSATGLDLLDVGDTRNTLRTLSPGEQEALLNFTPAPARLPVIVASHSSRWPGSMPCGTVRFAILSWVTLVTKTLASFLNSKADLPSFTSVVLRLKVPVPFLRPEILW